LFFWEAYAILIVYDMIPEKTFDEDTGQWFFQTNSKRAA
jgi:hypothetical protein